jgi:hypothetical protein
MRETVALVAVLYVLVYLLARARSRRAVPSIVVLCPLRSETAPEEILDRFGAPTRIGEPDRLAGGALTVGFATAGPGISLVSITDEASLDATLGRYLRRPVFGPTRDDCLPCLRDRKWNGAMLYSLALEVLHRERPRSLVVDVRPPAHDAPRISVTESDVDLGMYGYEILCRLRRYSRYREATFWLLFCDAGGAWLFTA